MHHPTDRIAHTTAFVTPVVEHWLEREIAQWVHPMKDRSDDPSHIYSHTHTYVEKQYIDIVIHQYIHSLFIMFVLCFLFCLFASP